MRTRTKARQRAVEALYEADIRNVDALEIVSRNPETNAYSAELVELVQKNAGRVDDSIATNAVGWQVDRLSAIDRAILRAATAELLFAPDIDTAIIISQAVEIAGVLGSDESGKFINGVLGNIALTRNSSSGL